MHRSLTALLTLGIIGAGLCPRADAQPAPPPSISTVTITAPTGTAAQPFRTNRSLIPLAFTSNATGGVFFATSRGAGIDLTAMLPSGGSGTVGAGFVTEGFHQATVTVSTAGISPVTSVVMVTSAPVFLVYDISPPKLDISLIKLRPTSPFEAYEPGRIYRTNASQIVLRGFVTDFPAGAGVSPDKIKISSRGVMRPSTVMASATGQWELNVDLSAEPDGPVDLGVVANDQVGETGGGNVSDEVSVGLR